MQIIVNGDSLEIEAELTLLALLARIGKSTEHVAIEHNGEVVDREDFAALTLNPQDRLEIVHFVGGG
jgi:thiamine biosynthesis protein ThiS